MDTLTKNGLLPNEHFSKQGSTAGDAKFDQLTPKCQTEAEYHTQISFVTNPAEILNNNHNYEKKTKTFQHCGFDSRDSN